MEQPINKQSYTARRMLWDVTRKESPFSRESQLKAFEDIVIASLARARSPKEFWARIAYAYQLPAFDPKLADLIEAHYSDIRLRPRWLLMCLRGAVLYEPNDQHDHRHSVRALSPRHR